MKYLFCLTILVVTLSSCGDCCSDSNACITLDNEFDENLARTLDADEYGMKKYVVAFLYKGANREMSQSKADSLQSLHMANIGRMADEGKLVLAGPFLGDQDLRGIYVFNVKSLGEAQQLTNSDPAIQAGSLRMELMEWYGSAAVSMINQLHGKLSEDPI